MSEPGPAPAIGRQYSAFLSYRHSDNKEEGRRWAEWLHHAIETYEVPLDLVGKPNMRGQPTPASLYPVFRDEEELPADADLSDNIQRALRNSASLVVLCSPRACESRFVEEEIRDFKEMGKGDRILALMIDGEPNASEDPAKLSLGLKECLPKTLRYGVLCEGLVDWNLKCEPIAADVRPDGNPFEGFTSSAAYRTSLEQLKVPARKSKQQAALYAERLQLAQLKIIAGLLGVSLGQLRARDSEFRFKKARKRQLLAVGVAILTTLLTSFALWQLGEVRHQKMQTEDQRSIAVNKQRVAEIAESESKERLREASRSDWWTAQHRLNEGNWREGIAYLGRSIRYDHSNLLAQQSMWLALQSSRHKYTPLAQTSLVHSKPVEDVTYSFDGTKVVTACNDREARIWDIITGEMVGAPYVHQGEVRRVCFNPLGTRLLTITEGKQAVVWQVSSNPKTPVSLSHPARVTGGAFSPDGNMIITTCEDGFARAWNPETGAPLLSPMFHSETIYEAQFNAKGDLLLTRGGDTTLRVWSTVSGRSIPPHLEHDAEVSSACFSREGDRILSTSEATARVWDIKTHKAIGKPMGGAGKINAACFSSDGSTVLTGDSDGVAQWWDWENGQRIGYPIQHKETIVKVALSPEGGRILIRGPETVSVFNSRGRNNVGAALEVTGAITTANFSPNGTTIVTANYDGTAHIWNSSTTRIFGRPLVNLKNVKDIKFSQDGKSIFTLRDKTFEAWSALNGDQWKKTEYSDEVLNLTSNLMGARVLTVDGGSKLQVWNPLEEPPGSISIEAGHTINNAKISLDGATVVTYQETGTELWDIKTQKPLKPLLGADSSDAFVEISADGKRLMTWGEKSLVMVWDVESGSKVFAPIERFRLQHARLSPDGSIMVLASQNESPRLWNALNGLPLNVELEHKGDLADIKFSGSSKQIVTVGYDGTALLWDTFTGCAIGQSIVHAGSVGGVEFSPDGSQLATSCNDDILRVWDIKPEGILGSNEAEFMSILFGGLYFEPANGSLKKISMEARLALRARISDNQNIPAEWRLLAKRISGGNAPDIQISTRSKMTVKEAVTAQFKTLNALAVSDASGADVTHPILPFALAFLELEEDEELGLPSNLSRAKWLADYGFKNLSPQSSAADLLLAAKFLAKVSERLPEEKSKVLSLLDRAVSLDSEKHYEAKQLRDLLSR